MTTTNRPSRKWLPIIDRAAEIVASYDTKVTLRQLFYRLVAESAIRNEQADYAHLSKLNMWTDVNGDDAQGRPKSLRGWQPSPGPRPFGPAYIER